VFVVLKNVLFSLNYQSISEDVLCRSDESR